MLLFHGDELFFVAESEYLSELLGSNFAGWNVWGKSTFYILFLPAFLSCFLRIFRISSLTCRRKRIIYETIAHVAFAVYRIALYGHPVCRGLEVLEDLEVSDGGPFEALWRVCVDAPL
jgi:hypothetical protein